MKKFEDTLQKARNIKRTSLAQLFESILTDMTEAISKTPKGHLRFEELMKAAGFKPSQYPKAVLQFGITIGKIAKKGEYYVIPTPDECQKVIEQQCKIVFDAIDAQPDGRANMANLLKATNYSKTWLEAVLGRMTKCGKIKKRTNYYFRASPKETPSALARFLSNTKNALNDSH